MNSPSLVPVCLLVGCILIADALQCQSPQYVIVGERGVVDCPFPKQFSGIVWYDSPNTSEALVTRLEKQDSGALKVSGNGYDTGNYNILSNGSLIIPSASVLHDRTFKVVFIDDTFKVDRADILLITIVYPSISTPVIESCGADSLCLVSPEEVDYLRCVFTLSRPPVLLSWSKNHEGRNTIEDVRSTNKSDGQYTFASFSTVNVSDLIQTSLNVFTCRASGPALNFQETKASVLVFNVGQDKKKSNETIIVKRTVVLHSHLEIVCTRRKPFAFVWTFERHNTSSVLVISANEQIKIIDNLNDTFDVSFDGSITFPNTSYRVEGIFTCTYFRDNISTFAMQQIIIGYDAVWTTPVVIISVLIVTIVGLLFGTFYVRGKMWIHFVPSTLEGTLTCCKKISEYILAWPLNNKKKSFAFTNDGIKLLRTVSEEIEENRRTKNIRVIGASFTSIIGTAIAFAGAFLVPITLGLSSGITVVGAVVGAAGAAVNIGSSLQQMLSDKNKRVKVQPALKTFFDFQKDLAVTINNLAIAFNLIRKMKESGQCKQAKVSRSLINRMGEIFARLEAGHYSLMLNEKLEVASKCTTEMLEIVEKELNNTPPNETFSMLETNLKEELKNAQEYPFENLASSIKTLVKSTNRERSKPTILTLVIFLFADSTDTNADVENVETCTVVASAAAAGRGVDGALNLASRGVIVGNRLLLKTLDLSDDAVRLTANITKMTKAVTVAGIILGAVGVAIDVAFLGHAVFDLMKNEKGESAQTLLDIADVMEEINHLSSRESKIVP